MRLDLKRAAIAGLLALAVASPMAAQRGVRGEQPPAVDGDLPAVSPGEVQRMFDSYALLQAHDQLQISDEQFPQFLARFKALQDVRRKNEQERARIVQELRKQVNDAQPDEAVMKDRLKALDELDARAQAEAAKAYESINQVLDIRQQAKFRVFEENMERRKLELVTRARQANRPPKQ